MVQDDRVSSSLAGHERVVQAISDRVKQFHQNGTKFRIYHGSTNSTRPSLRQADRMVDTSRLSNVLNVNTESKTALVEPNVPMDALVDATLKYGLLPPVVMEFPGITAGGGFAGIGGESSSFKHGYFDLSIRSIEIVLGNGDIITASTSSNRELLEGAAGSMGTLGVVTLLEIELIPAGKYVQLTYHSVRSAGEAVQTVLRETQKSENDFVDGIMLSATSGVIMAGCLTDTPNHSVSRFARARDEWFYIHASKQFQSSPSSSKPPQTVTIPMKDYLFRYDRGAFWMARHVFKYFWFAPFDRVSRFFLDPLLHTRPMYQAMHESGHYEKYIIQDLGVPVSNAEEFLDYVDKELGISPLWLCPLKPGYGTEWLRRKGWSIGQKESEGASEAKELVFNVGVWGPAPEKHEDLVKVNRSIERKIRELDGIKWPYSQYFYSEEEFWDIYDREMYDELRRKWHAEQLPTMWDKVKPSSERHKNRSGGLHGRLLRRLWDVWPVSGLYGVAKVLLGRTYLITKEKKAKIE
ncbi:FAD-binding domain-containing protein [Rhizodiscina lignyota]|uniref:Delta(24)-sterol reductase n=1 Tax=Rhizodiscina lignyota TaxID=1504668 RepID=A0A9P4IHM0_9PEZI|nr:FAD-binding domain-containing protein [Rhizodiscina lignyota]